MTWKEFKKWVDEQEVDDDAELVYMDAQPERFDLTLGRYPDGSVWIS